MPTFQKEKLFLFPETISDEHGKDEHPLWVMIVRHLIKREVIEVLLLFLCLEEFSEKWLLIIWELLFKHVGSETWFHQQALLISPWLTSDHLIIRNFIERKPVALLFLLCF